VSTASSPGARLMAKYGNGAMIADGQLIMAAVVLIILVVASLAFQTPAAHNHLTTPNRNERSRHAPGSSGTHGPRTGRKVHRQRIPEPTALS
jgi:hypothetical protein